MLALCLLSKSSQYKSTTSNLKYCHCIYDTLVVTSLSSEQIEIKAKSNPAWIFYALFTLLYCLLRAAVVWNTLNLRVAASVGDLGTSPCQRNEGMVSAKCAMANASLFPDRHYKEKSPGNEGTGHRKGGLLSICKRENNVKGIIFTGDNYMMVWHLFTLHRLLHTFLL